LAALGLATEGAVRIAPVAGLPQLLRDHGLDGDAVIRSHGCDPIVFDDLDNTIAFSAIGRLLVFIAATTGCLYPGLELGRQGGLNVSGAVGRAVRLAPNVGAALRAFVLNMHLHDRGAIPYLWADTHQAMFGYSLYCSDVIGADHIHDGALAIACNMIRELAGPGWRATEVRLFRDRAEDVKPFRDHFQAPVKFGAPQAAIVFPASDLARPCVNADPKRYAQAMSDLESLNVASGASFSDQVSRVLLRLLVTGVTADGAGPHQGLVAELFALHPRTLNRRLRQDGTTYSALLAQARFDVARELLRDTRLPVCEIARALGYAGTTPFSHAFRRWSGITAATWRERHGRP
jgi:AraC-like DNA-binding protein